MENDTGRVSAIDVDSGTWVLVTYGAMRFFGRVHELDFKTPSDEDKKKSENREFPVAEVVCATNISFKPVFDFFSPLRPVAITGPDGRPEMEGEGPMRKPKMGFQRDPVCVTRDFSSHPQVTHIRNGPGVVFDFFSQMHPDDKKVYQIFIQDALESMMRQRGGTTSSIALPTADQTAAVARHGRS